MPCLLPSWHTGRQWGDAAPRGDPGLWVLCSDLHPCREMGREVPPLHHSSFKPPASHCLAVTGPAWCHHISPAEVRVLSHRDPAGGSPFQSCSSKLCTGQGRSREQQGEEQSSSKREGGELQEEMEPTANWAVVCVVWRLLLTTRYN